MPAHIRDAILFNTDELPRHNIKIRKQAIEDVIRFLEIESGCILNSAEQRTAYDITASKLIDALDNGEI